MTQPSAPQPSLEEELRSLQAIYPDPEVLAQQMDLELTAFKETMRAAQPHWQTRMPGRDWTPAQEAEHTILVNEGTGRLVRLLLSDKPLRDAPKQQGELRDGRRLAPAGTQPGPELPLDVLMARHAATRPLLAGVRAEPDPARTFHHPFLGMLDAMDWLRMAAYQTRHHRQTLQAGLDRLNTGERAD